MKWQTSSTYPYPSSFGRQWRGSRRAHASRKYGLRWASNKRARERYPALRQRSSVAKNWVCVVPRVAAQPARMLLRGLWPLFTAPPPSRVPTSRTIAVPVERDFIRCNSLLTVLHIQAQRSLQCSFIGYLTKVYSSAWMCACTYGRG